MKPAENSMCFTRRDYAGMSLSTFRNLNPFTLCGILPLVPGFPVCSGDKLAFCSNRVVTTADDSCNSITDNLGKILALQSGTSCSSLGSDTDVCIAPDANAVSSHNSPVAFFAQSGGWLSCGLRSLLLHACLQLCHACKF